LQNSKRICRGIQELRQRLPSSAKESISTIYDYVDLGIKEYQGQSAPDGNSAPPERPFQDPLSTIQQEVERLHSNNALPSVFPASSSILDNTSKPLSNLSAHDSLTQLPSIGTGEYGSLISTTSEQTESLDVTLCDTLSLTLSDFPDLETRSNISDQNAIPDQYLQSGYLMVPSSVQGDACGPQQVLASCS
jgi:hypothetical protein